MKKIYMEIGFSIILAISMMGCSFVKANSNTTLKEPPSSKTIESKNTKSTEIQKRTSSANNTNPEAVKADLFYVEEIVRNYETLMVEAINNNDFSLIQNLFVPNSSFYNSQKRLVSNLFNKKIQEKLVDFDIKEITETDKEGVYKVYVNEKIGIKYPDKQDFEIKEFNWIYTVINEKGNLGLSDIEKWNK